jgi:hypothetical protein
METAEPPGEWPRTVCTASSPDEGLRIIDSDDEARIATSLDGSLGDRWPLSFAGHLTAEPEDGDHDGQTREHR